MSESKRRKHLTPLSDLVEKAARESARDAQRIAPQCLPTQEQIEARKRQERLTLRWNDPDQYDRRFAGHPDDQHDPEFWMGAEE